MDSKVSQRANALFLLNWKILYSVYRYITGAYIHKRLPVLHSHCPITGLGGEEASEVALDAGLHVCKPGTEPGFDKT